MLRACSLTSTANAVAAAGQRRGGRKEVEAICTKCGSNNA